MSAIDQLISARAALVRMREDVHAGCECADHCVDYHDAMRAVTLAADAIGMSVYELDAAARYVNRAVHGFVEVRP
jgi:hypothetical protein